jgi:hypothetical protein
MRAKTERIYQRRDRPSPLRRHRNDGAEGSAHLQPPAPFARLPDDDTDGRHADVENVEIACGDVGAA